MPTTLAGSLHVHNSGYFIGTVINTSDIHWGIRAQLTPCIQLPEVESLISSSSESPAVNNKLLTYFAVFLIESTCDNDSMTVTMWQYQCDS